MNVIGFKEAKCKNCYKCVRICEVKAIKVKNEQAQIMNDSCILCGHCFQACPQNAKSVISDIERVKEYIRTGKKTILSIAPAYLGILEYDNPGQVISALLALGFSEIRETAEGAIYVTKEYQKLINKGTMENIITTACPSVNDLVEIYYPELIPYLAPVVSPMIAHGKMIRKMYGDDVKIVFLGPCIAKKREALNDVRTSGYIDAVIYFSEVEKWMEEANIQIKGCKPVPPNNPDPMVNRLYPISSGIISSVVTTCEEEKEEDNDRGLVIDSEKENDIFKDVIKDLNSTNTKKANTRNHKNSMDNKYIDVSSNINSEIKYIYKKFYVHGIKNCMELLDSMKNNKVSGCFIEADICEGGCIKGSAIENNTRSRFQIKLELEEKIKKAPVKKEDMVKYREENFFEKIFYNRAPVEIKPSEEEIRKVLKMIGKEKKEDELNCSACGYATCRDKAIAVLKGKAEITMCMPYMHENARSLANVVLDTTPNAIVITDSELRICEFNEAAEKCFHKQRKEALSLAIYDFIDPSDFLFVLETKKSIINKKITFDQYEITTLLNIVYLKEQYGVMAVFQDITKEEEKNKQAYKVKVETIEMAQKVIDKQMMVAQQIAGLLGETTAETKVTLSKLRDTILFDGEEKL